MRCSMRMEDGVWFVGPPSWTKLADPPTEISGALIALLVESLVGLVMLV